MPRRKEPQGSETTARKEGKRAVLAANAPLSDDQKHNSFVLRLSKSSSAAHVPHATQQLVLDFRRVMEPKTASKLRERRTNTLKDYQAMAGPLGVSHFWVFSQGEQMLSLRFATFPGGPTCHFSVESFSLVRDVVAAVSGRKAPHVMPGLDAFRTSPLLVLSNFDVDTSAGRLLCAQLQGAFPTINTAKCNLNELKRVVLFERDPSDPALIYFRHYLIGVKVTGVSKPIRRLLSNKTATPSLAHLNDIGDYVLLRKDAGGVVSASESEIDEETIVQLAQELKSASGGAHPRDAKRAVQLSEIGPRMTLRLVRILDGFCAGSVLHKPQREQK